MPEQNPSFHYDKLVGVPLSQQHEIEKIHTYISQMRNIHNEAMLPGELEPTSHDVDIINRTAEHVIELLKNYGRDVSHSFDRAAVHLFPPGGTEAFQPKLAVGAHSALYGSILADRPESDVEFSLVLFHEMLHLLEYNALQITIPNEEGKSKIESYRTGFSVTSRDGKERFFTVFDEAIVGMLTKEFFERKLSTDPVYKEEIESRKDELTHSREVEEEELRELAIDLFEHNREEFGSVDDVLNLFIRSSVNGSLLPIARLIDKTYGKGSFRELGEASSYSKWHKKNF